MIKEIEGFKGIKDSKEIKKNKNWIILNNDLKNVSNNIIN